MNSSTGDAFLPRLIVEKTASPATNCASRTEQKSVAALKSLNYHVVSAGFLQRHRDARRGERGLLIHARKVKSNFRSQSRRLARGIVESHQRAL